MSENNAGGAVENPNDNGDVSFDKAQLLEKTPEELAELVMKASAGTINYKKKLEEIKKNTPNESKEEAKAETQGFDEEAFERKYNEKKFFEANPDMLEYKDKLSEYTSKGIDWDKAKKLVELDDETIANRKVASQSNFTSGEQPVGGKTTYTMEEFAEIGKQNPKRYAELLNEAKAGKIKVGT